MLVALGRALCPLPVAAVAVAISVWQVALESGTTCWCAVGFRRPIDHDFWNPVSDLSTIVDDTRRSLFKIHLHLNRLWFLDFWTFLGAALVF